MNIVVMNIGIVGLVTPSLETLFLCGVEDIAPVGDGIRFSREVVLCFGDVLSRLD